VYPFDPNKVLLRTAECIGNNSRFEFLEAMKASVDGMLEERAFESFLVIGKVSLKIGQFICRSNWWR
jgi:hypothetical protein